MYHPRMHWPQRVVVRGPQTHSVRVWGAPRRSALVILLALVLSCGCLNRNSLAANDSIMAASSGTHVWFLTEVQKPKPGVMIVHHAIDIEGAHFTDPPDVSVLSTLPQALAAWGSQLWMISYPEAAGGGAAGGAGGRDVMTVRAERFLSLDMYELVPRGRLELAAPLRAPGPGGNGGGRLVSATGTAEGPVVLFLPTQWAEGGTPIALRSRLGTSGNGEQAMGSGPSPLPLLDRPRLTQLQAGQWVELDLPADLLEAKEDTITRTGHMQWQLTAAGESGEEIWLVGTSPVRPHHLELRRRVDSKWESSSYTIDSGSLRSLTRVGSQVLAVLGQGKSKVESGNVESAKEIIPDLHFPLSTFDVTNSSLAGLEYLRQSMSLKLHRWREPATRWAAVGVRDGVRIIQEDRKTNTFSMTRVDGLTGHMGEPQTMELQSRGLEKILHVPILFAVCLAVLVAVMLVRPLGAGPRGAPGTMKPALPATMSPLSPMLRLAALVVDLIPGAVLTMIILDCDLSDLLRTPLFSLQIGDAIPSAVMIGLSIAHCMPSEMVYAKTLGKSFVGAQVVNHDGSKPGLARILVRNLLKGLTLCIPPLALVVVLNPYWKGVGDIMAMTIVVGPREPDEPPAMGNG